MLTPSQIDVDVGVPVSSHHVVRELLSTKRVRVGACPWQATVRLERCMDCVLVVDELRGCAPAFSRLDDLSHRQQFGVA